MRSELGCGKRKACPPAMQQKVGKFGVVAKRANVSARVRCDVGGRLCGRARDAGEDKARASAHA